jgi:hypothetical protein
MMPMWDPSAGVGFAVYLCLEKNLDSRLPLIPMGQTNCKPFAEVNSDSFILGKGPLAEKREETKGPCALAPIVTARQFYVKSRSRETVRYIAAARRETNHDNAIKHLLLAGLPAG